ncbi:hypothetical protein R1flu_003490 [Riccia fluitans]|uniref:Uncharacterized protein n=1 Tax=Riccia fluitans TaxID=41844 RepID=A0ABD1Y9R2_9MARC
MHIQQRRNEIRRRRATNRIIYIFPQLRTSIAQLIEAAPLTTTWRLNASKSNFSLFLGTYRYAPIST